MHSAALSEICFLRSRSQILEPINQTGKGFRYTFAILGYESEIKSRQISEMLGNLWQNTRI